jgi:hypothetical protein
MSEGQLTTVEAVKQYIFAGNAIFTLLSRKTGERYTYRFQLPRDQKAERQQILLARGNATEPSRYFVKLLAGPDNTGDYVYIGAFYRGTFRTTTKSKMTLESVPVRALQFFLRFLLVEKRMPSTLEVYHTGRCGRCGRLLTVPTSVASGIGPECAQKL